MTEKVSPELADLLGVKPSPVVIKPVPNTAPAPEKLVQPVIPANPQSANFIVHSKNYWYATGDKYTSDYKLGEINGNIQNKPNLQQFFELLVKTIEDTYYTEARRQQKTLESQKDNFKIAELIFKNLHRSITNTNIDPKSILAACQGFINSYIANTSNENTMQ